MIAVILAAGVGSRLRPMTNDKPKCLVTSAGKSILQYQLDSYKKAGIKDIVIVVGYEGQAIIEYCKHIKDFNIVIIENTIYEDSNNMYSLYLASSHVKGKPFILNNADLTIDESVVPGLLADPREDLVAVDVGLFNDESMKVSLNEQKFIDNISKQIKADASYGCSIDFYKFSKESSTILFEEIHNIIEVQKNLKDWTEVAMQRLFQAQKVKFEVFDIQQSPWVEIDNYDDLALSDKIFSQLSRPITSYKHFCFDLDGTVYVGNNKIDGAVDVINQLQTMGKDIFYISNNSSKNKADYQHRLSALGLKSNISQMVLSTDATAHYLKLNNVEKIYVLGTQSLQSALSSVGFEITNNDPEFVVLGYDTELNYEKLVEACRLINAGVDFIATHNDPVCPSEHGPIPDIGLLTEMVEKTTSRKAFKVFGKPSPDMLNTLCAQNDIDKSDILMIGDRLTTDIKMAIDSGIDSLLVLSGATTREMLETSEQQPTYTLNSVADIL